jgi:hypothetical protein
MAQPFEHASFEEPDEVREGENWRLELVNLAGGIQIGRITAQPGWRWSEHVKPVAGTELCMAPHQQYQLSGRMHVVMQDEPKSRQVRVKSRRYLLATTRGWSGMNQWSPSTGRALRSGHAKPRNNSGDARCTSSLML